MLGAAQGAAPSGPVPYEYDDDEALAGGYASY
jgi:hypothetical protein